MRLHAQETADPSETARDLEAAVADWNRAQKLMTDPRRRSELAASEEWIANLRRRHDEAIHTTSHPARILGEFRALPREGSR